MEIKENMYVRYKGEIAKIVEINTETFSNVCFRLDTFPEGAYQSLNVLENCKASFNIIKVLEKGDYVDGNEVLSITLPNICGDEELDDGLIHFANYNEYPQNIKDIVTHEQFEEMKYKVGE